MIQVAIPCIALVVALVLYFKRPTVYLSFCLWVWFLSPFVRRLVDYRLGWQDQSLILLSPHLVTAVAALSFVIPSSRRSGRVPGALLLCLGGAFYGFLVAMVINPSAQAFYGLLNWVTPLFLAAHVALEVPHYEENRAVIMKTFLWAAGLLGAYGIYQFFVAPPWDVYWLCNISEGLIDPSFGDPEPLKIRVWSTLNSPGTFSGVMMAALIFLLSSTSALKVPFSVIGYLSFLLCVVRAAWLGWAVSLVVFLRKARPQVLVKVLASLIVSALLLIPLLITLKDTVPVVSDRLATFTNLKQDESFQERQDMYRSVAGIISHDPIGHGLKNQEVIGTVVVDSGILITLLSLGWFGTAAYWSGILIVTFRSGRPATRDPFLTACQAICISTIAQYVGANIFVSIGGVIFWLCTGAILAGNASHQRDMATEQEPLTLESPLVAA